MSNVPPDNPRPKYDLEERTAVFGETIIAFARRVPQDVVTPPLISQMVKSGTSVGANYCEANDACSKRDFRHKIALCKKESHETKHWLRMIAAASPQAKTDARQLWQEAKELNLIFAAILRSKGSD